MHWKIICIWVPNQKEGSKWTPDSSFFNSRWSSQKKYTKQFHGLQYNPPKVLGHLVFFKEISIFYSPVHQVNMQNPVGPLKKNIPNRFVGYKTTPQSPSPCDFHFFQASPSGEHAKSIWSSPLGEHAKSDGPLKRYIPRSFVGYKTTPKVLCHLAL